MDLLGGRGAGGGADIPDIRSQLQALSAKGHTKARRLHRRSRRFLLERPDRQVGGNLDLHNATRDHTATHHVRTKPTAHNNQSTSHNLVNRV